MANHREMTFDPEAMDAAAKVAAEELKTLDAAAVKVVADWVAKHYLNAGYKRIGRILRDVSTGNGKKNGKKTTKNGK